MTDKLKRSISALKDDGLTVAGITDPVEWEKIGLDLGTLVSSKFRSVYSMTNVFSNYHQEIQMILWNTEKIITNKESGVDSVIRI